MTGADVLLIPGEPYDPDVARLMIYTVPAARALTRRQNDGYECVWCAAADGLAPLGGAHNWKPHGCAPCRKAWSTYLRAYVAWKRHLQECEPCRTVWCPDGWGYALSHELAYKATGKQQVIYSACGCPFAPSSSRLRPDIVNPVTNLSYGHTGPCRAPGTPSPEGEGATR